MRQRGSYKKSEASRRQVLDAAIRTLARSGYAHTSVNDIAQAAGMSKGAVHYHFQSKDDLITQVLVHCAQVMQERVRIAWDAPGSHTERVRRALAEMRALRKEGGPEQRVLADLMAQGIHDARLRKPIAAMFHEVRREILEQIERSVAELGLRPKIPPRVIPRLLVGTLDGVALHDFFDPPDEHDDAEIQRALEMISISLFEA
jgi:AcrR family transcriptional regulator